MTRDARRDDLELALAQRELVAAALELGDAREAKIRRSSSSRGVARSGVRRLDADVAEAAAVGAAQGHREVAAEPVARDERVARGSAAVASSSSRTVSAPSTSSQGVPASSNSRPSGSSTPWRQEARIRARSPSASTTSRDEGDLGVEGLGQVPDERAEEGVAHDAGRARGQEAQEVAVVPRDDRAAGEPAAGGAGRRSGEGW